MRQEHIGEVSTASVACGVLGMGGNKGAVAVSFSLYRRRIAFVCSHFAAHQVTTSSLTFLQNPHCPLYCNMQPPTFCFCFLLSLGFRSLFSRHGQQLSACKCQSFIVMFKAEAELGHAYSSSSIQLVYSVTKWSATSQLMSRSSEDMRQLSKMP